MVGMGHEMMMENLIEGLVYEEITREHIECGIWTTADGEEIFIKDMGSQHIRNCIKMLERNLEKYPDDMEHIAYCYIDLFNAELSKRYPPVDPAEL